jgi:hypothetical protein
MSASIDAATWGLSRLLDPIVECFTPDVATQVANLPTDPQLQARLDELAAKSNAGTLTEEEAIEYDAYIQAMDVRAVIQAKSRSIVACANKFDG